MTTLTPFAIATTNSEINHATSGGTMDNSLTDSAHAFAAGNNNRMLHLHQ
jgi:hypothetical protein